MSNKMRDLFFKYKEIILYLFFGVLTTGVNYAIYFPLVNYCSMAASVSNMIAWVGAVIFAFATNKPFVFQSHDWSVKILFPELWKFVSCRIGSGILETAMIGFFVDYLQRNGIIWKIITSILVVVLNYIGSKLLIFKKKQ